MTSEWKGLTTSVLSNGLTTGAITLVSSFAGPETVQKIQRWDKASQIYTEVERPYIVHGSCGFVGLIYSQIDVPHQILLLVHVHLLAHHHPQ